MIILVRCKETNQHIDRLRCPVHVAAEMGQIGVLRAFVHHDISNVLAQDGKSCTMTSPTCWPRVVSHAL